MQTPCPFAFHVLCFVLAMVACGQPVLLDSVAAMSDRSKEFEGNWEYKGGSTARTRCNDGAAATTQLDDSGLQLNFDTAVGADLIVRQGSCTWEFDVVGSEAFARGEQECTFTANFSTVEYTIEDGMFVIDADGRTISQNDTIFRTKLRDSNGNVTTTCTETRNGELRKAPRGSSTSSSSSSGFTSSSSTTGSGGCTNTCTYHDDGACDDGGPGSSFSFCTLGTDCNDCGFR